MKRYLILLVVLLSAVDAICQRTDFSGEYVLDRKRTDLKGMPAHVFPVSIAVEQKKRVVFITRSMVDRNGRELPLVSDTLDFRGGISFQPARSGGQIETSLKWIDELSFALSIEAPTVRMREVWSIIGEDRTLRIVRELMTDGGNVVRWELFYDRKK